MGTVGSYDYDDATCERVVEATRELVDLLRDEVRAQGPEYLEAYLANLRLMVAYRLAEVTDDGDTVAVILARVGMPDRTRDGDPLR